MRCPNCNDEVPENKNFCGNCGHRLIPPAPGKFEENSPTTLVPIEAEVHDAATPSPHETLEPKVVTSEPPSSEPDPPIEEPPERIIPPAATPSKKPKRRIPGWLWVLIIGVLIIIFAVYAFNLLPIFNITQEPWRFALWRHCGDTYHVSTQQPLEIEYGFRGAKGEELVEENADHLRVDFTIDGEHMQGIRMPAVDDTNLPCFEPYREEYENDYWIYFLIELEPLSPGEHVAEVTLSYDQEITDGFDFDGDGELDFYGPGEIFSRQFTIISE